MELQISLFQVLITFFLVLFMAAITSIRKSKARNLTQGLIPGPRKLPLIGNLHQLAGPGLPHHTLRDLATKYGAIMHLQLGQISTVVVSSAEMAKEIMKTHDIVFANRPVLASAKILTYGCTDIAFTPYGNYWRNLRKICTSELLNATRVASFQSIREEEVLNLVETIKPNEGSAVNLSHKVFSLSYGITARAAFGKKCKDQEAFISVVTEETKDIFSGGSETSAGAVEWALSEMIKNPRVMTKAQEEVRQVFQGKGNVDETGIHQLKYLKCVIKETLRLHPVIPLLIPRESMKNCVVNGFEIPAKTRVIVNAWAIERDPNHWVEPERFVNSSVDFIGTNFEFIPFGAGRRVCPGILFALPTVELPLAQLLFHFDWKLPRGMKQEDIDMTEVFGVTVRRKNDLVLVPSLYRASTTVA
uniref:Cytochrome P450 n=1 Tax=Gossypium raimondii TaxID=29730 RepID=A0A0D2UYU5_GOSRA|nr:hypothetical protein B456_009G358600 [Gossypium raimondii]